jgi:hypothetical protein
VSPMGMSQVLAEQFPGTARTPAGAAHADRLTLCRAAPIIAVPG